MGIRPMLGSVSWGPYSHKAHALSFQLYPTLKVSRKPEPEVLRFLKVSAIKTPPKNKPHKTTIK
jgi:hypothetical protein